jgi:hypothetical protein
MGIIVADLMRGERGSDRGQTPSPLRERAEERVEDVFASGGV